MLATPPTAAALGHSSLRRLAHLSQRRPLGHAFRHRSRSSVELVRQIIGVPLTVTPRSPGPEQNAPGWTVGCAMGVGFGARRTVGRAAGRVVDVRG